MKKILIAVVAVIALFSGCSKDDEEVTPQTSTGNTAREAALNDYNNNYLGSSVGNTGWTGNTASCIAGSVSAATHTAVINRINYFRRMVGLNSNCTIDHSFDSQQAEAALMLSANNALSHNPPSSWSCYTTSGATGCAQSNIALGVSASNAVTAFMFDMGTGNEPVGHRRWILHSRKQKFGHGSTSTAMALYVLGSDTNSVIPEFIAYPPKGYIPNTLVPTRWSFSIPNAGFASATVSVTGPTGNAISTNIISRAVGYGDNTIVFEPSGIDNSNVNDVSYTVTVSGITGASQSQYTYTTTIFKP